LAVQMIGRAIAANVPFSWVAADSVYGVGELETALRRAGKGYVLGVSATHQFHSWGRTPAVSGTAESIAGSLDASAWQRLSAGEGTKGARLYDWAYLELADLDAAEFNKALSGTWTRGLLLRRSLADGKPAVFTTWCPAGTGTAKLVQVEGCRWAIEDSFETAKTELGLDHNETRSWRGWHRHVSFVMLAFAMMASIRHHVNQPAPQKHRRACPGHACPRHAGHRPRHAGPRHAEPRHASPHPLVGPGNPPHRHTPGPSPHPARPCHRMVALAQGAPSRRITLISEMKTAAVMLERVGLERLP